MKYQFFRVLFFFFLCSATLSAQNEEILCEPCVQQFIADNNIVDVKKSADCDFIFYFEKADGSTFLRYTSDYCNAPTVILFVICENLYSIGTTCSSMNSCNIEIEMVQTSECGIIPREIVSGVLLNDLGNLHLPNFVGAKALIGYTVGPQLPFLCTNTETPRTVTINCVNEINNTSCSVEVVMESLLNNCGTAPREVISGKLLNVCSIASGWPQLPGVGGKANIGYELVNCGPSNCNFSEYQVHITCVEPLDSRDFIICKSFEDYNNGNVVPQGSPDFTLYSNVPSQNATVSTAYASSGTKSLKINNSTNLDFNISRILAEDKVARLDWNMYIPTGKSGVLSLETNNPNVYYAQIQCQSGSGTIYEKQIINGVEQLVAKISAEIKNNVWVPVAIVFQPFEDEIEIWINHNMVYAVKGYRSNLVTDLNFSYLPGANNTEMYVDELCYREWSRNQNCVNWVVPVCVNNITYSNSCVASLDGYSEEEIMDGECGFPLCTHIISPLQGDTNVPVNEVIGWDPVQNATSYLLRIGITPDGGEILNNIDVGNNLTYLLSNLPYNTKIFVKVQPKNDIGINSACLEVSFTTKSNVQIPACSPITSPSNFEQNVPTTINITWQSAAAATGYKLKIGSSAGGSEILNQTLGNVTSYIVQNLPADKNLCATIIPFNSAGENTNCTSTCFKTKAVTQLPACSSVTSPSNNEQNVPTTLNLVWTASPGANGYKIKLGTNNFSSDVLPLTDVGNVTNFIVSSLPLDKFICATIIPYNGAGEVTNCSNTCFKTIIASGTAEEMKEKLIVFPNPTSDEITIFGNGLKGNVAKVKIISLDGRMVQTVDYKLGNPINISKLTDGMYLIYIDIDNEVITKKLIVLHH